MSSLRNLTNKQEQAGAQFPLPRLVSHMNSLTHHWIHKVS